MSGRSKSFTAQLRLAGATEDVFPLFSPMGEKLWVPGWEVEILHPAEEGWEEGEIFRTQEETGEAIWVVSILDHESHRVVYHRVESDRYVARIEVRCSPAGEESTAATITYAYVGLSKRGDDDIDEMTDNAFRLKMERWVKWINHYLRTRRTP